MLGRARAHSLGKTRVGAALTISVCASNGRRLRQLKVQTHLQTQMVSCRSYGRLVNRTGQPQRHVRSVSLLSGCLSLCGVLSVWSASSRSLSWASPGNTSSSGSSADPEQQASWLSFNLDAKNILSAIPDSIMDEKTKSSLLELSTFADKVLRQKMSEKAFQDANNHPQLVNLSLLRIYSIAHAKQQQVVVGDTSAANSSCSASPSSKGSGGPESLLRAAVDTIAANVEAVMQQQQSKEMLEQRVGAQELEKDAQLVGEDEMRATEQAMKQYVLVDVAEKVCFDNAFMALIMRQLQYASEVYNTGKKQEVLAGKLPAVPLDDIVLSEYTNPIAGSSSSGGSPANLGTGPTGELSGQPGDTHLTVPRYMVFLDHLTKQVVVAVRGTASLSDVITDLYAETTPFLSRDKGLYTHRGMYESAEALLPHVTAAIHAAKSREAGKYKEYEVVVTGHSLGAGVACLLALLLSIKSLIPSTTFAFAPPPTLSVYDLSPGSTLHQLTSKAPIKMHSFVHNEDVITRCSYREMMHLLGSLAAIDCMKWSPLKRSTILLRGYLTPEEQLEMQIALLPLMQDEKRMRRHAPTGDLLRQKFNKVRDMMRLLDPSRQKSADALVGEVTDTEHNNENFHEHVELYIPGTVYWLRPDQLDENAAVADVAKSAAKVDEQVLTPSYTSYRLNSSQDLYTGFLFTGLTMVADHLLIPYINAFLQLRKEK